MVWPVSSKMGAKVNNIAMEYLRGKLLFWECEVTFCHMWYIKLQEFFRCSFYLSMHCILTVAVTTYYKSNVQRSLSVCERLAHQISYLIENGVPWQGAGEFVIFKYPVEGYRHSLNVFKPEFPHFKERLLCVQLSMLGSWAWAIHIAWAIHCGVELYIGG